LKTRVTGKPLSLSIWRGSDVLGLLLEDPTASNSAADIANRTAVMLKCFVRKSCRMPRSGANFLSSSQVVDETGDHLIVLRLALFDEQGGYRNPADDGGEHLAKMDGVMRRRGGSG
jgi:hypothetical protein